MRRRSRTPKPWCWACRGMPPAWGSRSTTTTRPAPRARSAAAAVRPAGPPPTTAPSTASAIVPEERPHLGAAVEALAAAHEHPGAPPQPVEVDGRDRTLQRVANLAPRRPLAEADHAAVGGIAPDPLRIGVRAQHRFPDRRHPDGRQPTRPLAQGQARALELVADVLGKRQRGGQSGRADPARPGIPALAVDPDLVVGVLGCRAQ